MSVENGGKSMVISGTAASIFDQCNGAAHGKRSALGEEENGSIRPLRNTSKVVVSAHCIIAMHTRAGAARRT